MNKARKKFIIYAELAIFVLLSVLLSLLNILNFSMASDDADFLTDMIAVNHGKMKKAGKNETNGSDLSSDRWGQKNGFNMMVPDSPEMKSSLRYFTVSFDDEDGKADFVEFRMSAVSEEDAEKWARSLLGGSTGWSNTTYRYRVYHAKGKTYVTVIDQARELGPCYRILFISVIGEVVLLSVSMLLLLLIGKRLFKPVEEADRKQRQFIARLEKEFKMPLTVMNADTEILERKNGSTEETQSINRQVRKMSGLLKELAELSVFREDSPSLSRTDISHLLSLTLDIHKKEFEEKGLPLEHRIEDGIDLKCDEQAIRRAFDEIIKNALQYSTGKVSFELYAKKERIILTQTNETTLSDGSCDQIFDRFTRLENAADTEGSGLGLSYVRDIVKAHNGRISAKVTDGVFLLKLDL